MADVNGLNDGPNSGKGENLDGLVSRTAEFRKTLDAESVRAYSELRRPRDVVDVLLRKLVEAEKEQKQENARHDQFAKLDGQLTALNVEVARLRGLVDQENRLTAEIRSKLVRAGIPVVEHSERAKRLDVGGGATWTRPDAKTARDAQLIGASHLLLTEIRKPERRGRYQLSVRLVEVATGTIVWEDQGDRFDVTQQALDLAAPTYLLNSGTMTLLEFGGYTPVLPRPLQELGGGLPIRMDDILLRAVSTDATAAPEKRGRKSAPEARPRRDAEGIYSRLGYIDSVRSAEGIAEGFRDLFGTSIQRIDRLPVDGADSPSGLAPPTAVRRTRVNSGAEVPEAHQMRYLVWRLARSILPLAGRVADVDGELVHLTLGRDDKVSVGDRLTVLRPSPASSKDPASPVSVLPVELMLREVHEHSSIAFSNAAEDVGPSSSGRVPPRIQVQPGDIVHRKLARPISVAVLDPVVDLANLNPALLNRFGEANLRKLVDHAGRRLAMLVQSGLLEQRVRIIDRESRDKVMAEQRSVDLDPDTVVAIGKLTGATHIILGTISPAPEVSETNDGRAPVSMRIVDVESGVVLDRVAFNYTRTQMENWKP